MPSTATQRLSNNCMSQSICSVVTYQHSSWMLRIVLNVKWLINSPIDSLQLTVSRAYILSLLIFTFWQVLFISEYKDDGVPHLPVIDDPVELLPGLVYPVPVRAVHHEDETLGARVVMSPQRTDLVLTSNILKRGKWEKLRLDSDQQCRFV